MEQKKHTAITLKAPAKLNLFLRILGRRLDGMHMLHSLVAPLSLCDDVTLSSIENSNNVEFAFTFSPDLEKHFEFEFPEPSKRSEMFKELCSDKNLCVQAADSFLKAAQIAKGIKIELTKRIPIGAGLGGGSSDAAAVLVGLNELFDYPLSEETLFDLAASLGADVSSVLYPEPVFFYSSGEKLLRVPEEIKQKFSAIEVLIVKPVTQVPSRDAYRLLGLEPKLSSDDAQKIGFQPIDMATKSALNFWGLELLGDENLKLSNNLTLLPQSGSSWGPKNRGGFFNDFENTIIDNYPEVGKVFDVLSKCLTNSSNEAIVLLAGSGSTVVALAPAFSDTEFLLEQLRNASKGTWYLAASSIIHDASILGRRQVGKAPDFDSGIRRFESSRPSSF